MVDCSCFRNIEYRYVKLHYFLFNAGLSCVLPFLPVYAQEIGISAISVGVIYCVLPVFTMLLKPLFGLLADHFNFIRGFVCIFLCVIVLSSATTVSIPHKQSMLNSVIHCSATGTKLTFMSKPSPTCKVDEISNKPLKCYMQCSECIEYSSSALHENVSMEKPCSKKVVHPAKINVQVEKSGNSSHAVIVKEMDLSDRIMNTECLVNLTFTCNALCDPVLHECFTGKEEPEYSSIQFSLFFFFAALCISMSGVATSFSDAICFSELGENAHLYGRQRLWGTVGWGLFSPIAGFFNDLITGDSFLKAYQPGSIIQTVLLCYDIYAVKNLRTRNFKYSQNIFKDVKKVLLKFKVTVFILAVFVFGIFTAFMWSFLFWHLRTKGASKLLLGLASAVQCFIGELPYFFFAGTLIKKLGHFNILIVIFIAFGARFVGYSYITNPWWVLPLEILQGPTFGLFYATMATFANAAALPGTEVTIQGMVGSVFELGMVVGNLVGGWVMQTRDGSFLFFWAGVASFCYCVISFILNFIVRSIDKKAESNQQEVASPAEENASFM